MTTPAQPFARLRLDGDRFRGGRLPISALQELERYERLIRDAAVAAWRAEHPGKNLPRGFKKSFSLAISEIEDNSATSVLIREGTSKHDEWFELGGVEVDRAFQALISGAELPAAFNWAGSRDFADFGSSLVGAEAIELYPEKGKAVRYTEAVRREVAHRLQPPIEPDISPVNVTRMIAGRLVALDADRQTFRMLRLGGQKIAGAFDSSDLTEDLREVLNSSAIAPVVRVTGLIELDSDGLPERVLDAVDVELFEIDGAPWSRRLIELAELEPGWFEGSGARVKFDALDAARDLLRLLQDRGLATPAIFPTEEGGVQLQWASAESATTYEVTPDLSINLNRLVVSPRSFSATEFDNFADAQDAVLRVIA